LTVTAAQTPRTEAGLVRAIGVRRLTAILINATVGAGIFVLPGTAAAGLGRAAPFAYLVCAVAMALIVACIAAAGSRVAVTGGLYAYTEAALGPFVGFLAGALYWAAASFGVASVAAALVSSLAVLWPPADQGATRVAIIGVAIAVLAWVNVRGVAPGSRVVEIVTVAKLLPLVVLVAAGLWLFPVDPRSWLPVPSAPAVGQTAILLLFAFVGIEVALVPSGEIREPARTVPRAAFTALAFTTLLYLAIQAVAQAVLGESMRDYAAAPLAEAASHLLGTGGRLLVLGGAAVSMFGYLSGDMLCTPRAIFAFGRDGLLPKVFASVHPRLRTPWIAIITHSVIVAALSTTGRFAELVVMANVATLILYFLCVVAAYQLQRRDVRAGGLPFMLPGGPLVPIAASAVIVWLLWQATAREFLVTAGVVAVAAVYYGVRRNWRFNLQDL
jgi:basic amino acid/polyamine antiporter, APA family